MESTVDIFPFFFISGQFPLVEGRMQYPGKLGINVSDAGGYAAARLAGLNVLAQLYAATDSIRTYALTKCCRCRAI